MEAIVPVLPLCRHLVLTHTGQPLSFLFVRFYPFGPSYSSPNPKTLFRPRLYEGGSVVKGEKEGLWHRRAARSYDACHEQI